MSDNFTQTEFILDAKFGDQVAVGNTPGTVLIYRREDIELVDYRTGKLLHRWRDLAPEYGRLSPKVNAFIGQNREGNVSSYPLDGDKPIPFGNGDTHFAYSYAGFSADGQLLVTQSLSTGEMRWWDYRKQVLLAVQDSNPSWFAVSHDCRCVVGGDIEYYTRPIVIYHFRENGHLSVVHGPKMPCKDVALLKSDQHFAAADYHGNCHIFQTKDCANVRTFSVSKRQIIHLCYIEKNDWLIACDDTGVTTAWNWQTGELLKTIASITTPSSFLSLNGGEWLVVTSHGKTRFLRYE